METVQQNGRFTLFSSKFLSIYSILYAYNMIKLFGTYLMTYNMIKLFRTFLITYHMIIRKCFKYT